MVLPLEGEDKCIHYWSNTCTWWTKWKHHAFATITLSVEKEESVNHKFKKTSLHIWFLGMRCTVYRMGTHTYAHVHPSFIPPTHIYSMQLQVVGRMIPTCCRYSLRVWTEGIDYTVQQKTYFFFTYIKKREEKRNKNRDTPGSKTMFASFGKLEIMTVRPVPPLSLSHHIEFSQRRWCD